MQGEKKKSIILCCVLVILIIALDQGTKQLIIHNYALGEGTPVIKDVFEILHINNTGSAWGMLSGKTWLLTVFSVVMVGLLLYVLKNVLTDRHYLPIRIIISCVLGGAIGNMIDRIRLGYVTDFLYIKLINFPVFNVADIFVTIPVILLIIFMIFKYRSDDFDVILGDKIRQDDGSYIEKKKRKAE